MLSSACEELVAFADVLHSALQVRHPTWRLMGEPDAGTAADQRMSILDRLADSGSIGFGVHMADVGFGRVRRHPTGFAWHALD